MGQHLQEPFIRCGPAGRAPHKSSRFVLPVGGFKGWSVCFIRVTLFYYKGLNDSNNLPLKARLALQGQSMEHLSNSLPTRVEDMLRYWQRTHFRQNRNRITNIAASRPGEIAQKLSPILLARHQLQRVQDFDKSLRMSDVRPTMSAPLGTLFLKLQSTLIHA